MRTKPRDVFDVGTDGLCDDNDIYCDNEPYNILVEGTSMDTDDNLNWTRNDIDGTTINLPLQDDGQLLDDFDVEHEDF